MQHQCDTTEMGPSRFSARDVHRIGILDIRLFNTDRHAGNMLVRTPRSAVASSADLKSRMVAAAEAQYELVPIDHGFCLPEALEAPYFEWLHWPQTVLPFTEDELQYIHDLDVEVRACAPEKPGRGVLDGVQAAHQCSLVPDTCMVKYDAGMTVGWLSCSLVCCCPPPVSAL